MNCGILTDMRSKCACGCGENLPPRSKKHPDRVAHFCQGHWSRTRAAHQMKVASRLAPPADWIIPSGRCECGCGKKTSIAKVSKPDAGHYAGYPLRFIHGHNGRTLTGSRASGWKGGRWRQNGYVMVWTGPNSYKPEHVLVWEKAHGPVPSGHHVHHKNAVRDDNRLRNLQCLSPSDHKRTHQHQFGVYHQHWSDDDLIMSYYLLWKRLGQQPLNRQCRPKNGTPTWNTYLRRFGSAQRVRELASKHL